jgi:MEMO1 family protein
MRYPAVAGRFYPSEKDELISSIRSCFSNPLGPGLPGASSKERRIVGAVCPHAGYQASGMNAAHTYRAIAEDGFPEAYVIIGPDHYGVPFDAVMCSEEYLTPLGPCKVHKEIAAKLSELMPDNVRAHRAEHSIEVQVPFIQYIDPDPHIVPIIMSRQDIQSARRLADKIKAACKGRDVLVIASSDMAHYVPKNVGESINSSVIERYVSKDLDGMYSTIISKNVSVCGYGPMAAAMLSMDPKKVQLLKYSDSWDSLEFDMNSVVGYASIIMTR